MSTARTELVALMACCLGACGSDEAAPRDDEAATDGWAGVGGMAPAAVAAGVGGTSATGGGSPETGGSVPGAGGAATGGWATGGLSMGGMPEAPGGPTASGGGIPDGTAAGGRENAGEGGAGSPNGGGSFAAGGSSSSSGGDGGLGGSGSGGTSTGGAGGVTTPGGGTSGDGGGEENAGDGGGASGDGGASGGESGGYDAGGASSGGAVTGGRPQIVAAPGATLVSIDPSTRYQTFEGWGTSLCWWANRIGGWSTGKQAEFLDWIVNPTTGLGYNVFRYNIGGGDDPTHDHMGQDRDMPGFQTSQGSWDWDADARQTSVLSQLAETGQDVILEAFSNSPPYWMTRSGCASGNTDGSDNLKEDSYEAFADYLTEVVKHYRDELGITFRTLEPMNEPNASWWKADGGQEGCHFGAVSQQRIIKAVGAQLVAKGLTETQVSASDENSMDDAYSIMSGYDSTTLAYVSQMNAHSYAGSKRSELRSLAESQGKRLWQSESGPLGMTLDGNTEAAMFMAGRIITDLRELRPQAWIDWQVVDPSITWTSFTVNDAQETWTPEKRFFMHAGFSRFIRPGATFVEIDNADMVAAVAEDSSVLTVVVRNGETGTTRPFTFDLTGLPSVGTTVEVHRTSATEDLVSLPSIPVQDWSFTVTSEPYSVTTYVIPLGE